ncbi:hypothetical protein [Bdellovibrio sp. HCB-162]|uniref:hypothetical protein n=1 Tax=Bdellovibrio sp. HCB-162 TaxID=3394234 RepID=UPI0039BD1B32
MRSWLFIVAFTFAGFANAQVSRAKMPSLNEDPNILKVFLLNPEMRFERGDSQELVDRKPLNFALALQMRKFSVLTEYARFEENTGNTTSSIDRTHTDLVVWGRYHFFNGTNPNRSVDSTLYAGIGAGLYEEEIVTTLMGSSRTDKSNPKFMSGVSVGGEVALNVNKDFGFVGGLEGRALFASDFDPNPVWSAVLRLGFQLAL